MLEKTKWAIQNGQSRDTGNTGHKTQNEDKQNKNHRHHKKIGVNPGTKGKHQSHQRNVHDNQKSIAVCC